MKMKKLIWCLCSVSLAVLLLMCGTATADGIKYEVYNNGVFTGITKVIRYAETAEGSGERYISVKELYKLGLWAEDIENGVRLCGNGKSIDVYTDGKSTSLDGYSFEDAVLEIQNDKYLMLDVVGICFSEDYRGVASDGVIKIFFDVNADEKAKACTAVKLSPELYDFKNGFFTVRIANDTYFGFDGVNVYVAYYDGDGRMIKSDVRRIYTIEPKTTRTAVISIGGTFDEARSISVMLWDKDNMPLANLSAVKEYDYGNLVLPPEKISEREVLFDDIGAESEYYEAVYVMNKNYGSSGYFNGYEDGTYKPGGAVLKSEFCHMLTTLTGLDFAKTEVAYDFADVAYSHWAKNNIAYAVSKGFVSEEDGYFSPDDRVTTSEALTAFLKILGRTDISSENVVTGAEKSGLATGADLSETNITRGNLTILAYNFIRLYRGRV